MPDTKEHKHRTLSLPKDLYERVVVAISDSRYGYTSVAEFVKDAVRRRIEELDLKNK